MAAANCYRGRLVTFQTELEALPNAFEYTVKKMATTLARKAWYALEDYATARQYGIDRFTLMIERKEVLGARAMTRRF